MVKPGPLERVTVWGVPAPAPCLLEDDEECVGRQRVDSRNDCTLLRGLDGKGATSRLYSIRAAFLRPTTGSNRADFGIVSVPSSGEEATLFFSRL